MPTQKFWIKGMRHEDETPVTERVRGVRGVLFAIANHGDQCAEVEFEDDIVTEREIRDAIAELGFDVRSAG